MIDRFVLDCSLTMSWCIQGEKSRATEAILDRFAQGSRALVPALWFWEVNNVMLTAERLGRIDPAKRHEQVTILKKLPIDIDEDAHKQAWSDAAALACTHRLSIYDAAYLEMALRYGLPLGSLDKTLRHAAGKIGVICCPPDRAPD